MQLAWRSGLLLIVLAGPLCADPAIERAIAYLSAEVPRWPAENGCFSCHNNGDGARALLAARRAGYDVPEAALAGTREWLLEPARWVENKGNPAASDLVLAQVQFAWTLASLGPPDAAGEFVAWSAAVTASAGALMDMQDPTGAWVIEGGDAAGSPATYGTPLATAIGLRTLSMAASPEPSIVVAKSRARESLGQVVLRNLPAAAAVLMGCAGAGDCPPAREALAYVLRCRSTQGGWGPYPNSAPEAFDTALALIALEDWRRATGATGHDAGIAQGRQFLLDAQLPAGGWAETTRPAGGVSYAQHISTSGWALYALVFTENLTSGASR